MGSKFGFGHVGFGRANYGQSSSEYEPRYSSSDPTDGETGVSEYKEAIRFSMYCFSSRVQWESGSGCLIEISENGGTSYVSAYEDGAFVSPFDGSLSRVYPQDEDSQSFEIVIAKSSGLWADGQEIRIRVTAEDEYGNAATKETPVEW